MLRIVGVPLEPSLTRVAPVTHSGCRPSWTRPLRQELHRSVRLRFERHVSRWAGRGSASYAQFPSGVAANQTFHPTGPLRSRNLLETTAVRGTNPGGGGAPSRWYDPAIHPQHPDRGTVCEIIIEIVFRILRHELSAEVRTVSAHLNRACMRAPGPACSHPSN